MDRSPYATILKVIVVELCLQKSMTTLSSSAPSLLIVAVFPAIVATTLFFHTSCLIEVKEGGPLMSRSGPCEHSVRYFKVEGSIPSDAAFADFSSVGTELHLKSSSCFLAALSVMNGVEERH